MPVNPTGTTISFFEENPESKSSEPQSHLSVNPGNQSKVDQSVTNTSEQDQNSAAAIFPSQNKLLVRNPFAERCAIASQGLPNRIPPELINSGLEHIFQGPQPNQFKAELEAYVIKSLNASPHYQGNSATLANARKHLARLVKGLDWITLQTYWDECQGEASAAVDVEIAAELKRLNWTCELPEDWRDRTDCIITSDLNYEQRKWYLAYLKLQEVTYVF